MPATDRRVGIELELLAPDGSDRAVLAESIARSIGGSVSTDWHVDSEPSAHRSVPVFHHLTPAFNVVDEGGEPFARIVSDVTIHADLDVRRPSRPGWNRVLSDDPRILRMVRSSLPATGLSNDDLTALADRFGLSMQHGTGPEPMTRFFDDTGASVLVVAGLPGGKERVAECISPPLTDCDPWIDTITGVAGELDFLVPAEGATHLHYDASLFADPAVFQRLVRTFCRGHDIIRRMLDTNPNCRRLGPLPSELAELVERADYGSMSWDAIVTEATGIESITKYADVNLIHLLAENPRVPTVEFRPLPATLDPDHLKGLKATVDRLVGDLVAPAAAA